jgi:hypothetical protein
MLHNFIVKKIGIRKGSRHKTWDRIPETTSYYFLHYYIQNLFESHKISCITGIQTYLIVIKEALA